MKSYEVIKAFKALKKRWVTPETIYTVSGSYNNEQLFIVNPNYPPMRWNVKEQSWEIIKPELGVFIK